MVVTSCNIRTTNANVFQLVPKLEAARHLSPPIMVSS